MSHPSRWGGPVSCEAQIGFHRSCLSRELLDAPSMARPSLEHQHGSAEGRCAVFTKDYELWKRKLENALPKTVAHVDQSAKSSSSCYIDKH